MFQLSGVHCRARGLPELAHEPSAKPGSGSMASQSALHILRHGLEDLSGSEFRGLGFRGFAV